MKVVLANKFFYDRGGAETVLFQERDALMAAGIEVADFAMHDPRNRPSRTAADFVAPRDYRGGNSLARLAAAATLVHSPEAVRRLTVLIKREQPDILHCHNIYHQLTPSILGAARRLGVRVVLTLHDYKPICPTYRRLRAGRPCAKCEDGRLLPLLRHRCAGGSLARSALLLAEAMVQRDSYECVDRVIAPSHFMARAATRWRFPPERVVVLHNGVDPAAFVPRFDDDGYLLFLGRLSEEKGLLTLGRAQAETGLAVKVAGTGPMDAQLRRDAPGLDLVGHVAGAELRALVGGAAAIVVPSEWDENCPMSVLEAMAAGKAVIASRMGGIPELVQDGLTGRLFPAGDSSGLARCMVEVMSDKAWRIEMGRQGRRRAEAEFSLERHMAGLQAIYHTLAAA